MRLYVSCHHELSRWLVKNPGLGWNVSGLLNWGDPGDYRIGKCIQSADHFLWGKKIYG